jgi:hypothetical protein
MITARNVLKRLKTRDMKTKHTPGPWTFDSRATGTYNVRTESRYIAIISDHPKRELSDQMLPNAKLIAAAPELLEACASVLNANNNSLPAVVIIQLNEAIEKATK